jgi:hypothetical protein
MNAFYSNIRIGDGKALPMIQPRWLAVDGASIKYDKHTKPKDRFGVFISWPDGGSVFGEDSGTEWLVPALRNAVEQGVQYFVLVLSESAGLDAFNAYTSTAELEQFYDVQRLVVHTPVVDVTEEIIFMKLYDEY